MYKSLIVASAKAQSCLGHKYIHNESPKLNLEIVIKTKNLWVKGRGIISSWKMK